MARALRPFFDRKPDLTADFHAGCAGRSLPYDPFGGQTAFRLGGLYSFTTDAEGLEIEFTHTISLQRSLLRLRRGVTLYMNLPPAQYRLGYCLLSPSEEPVQITAVKTGLWQKLSLYVQKLTRLRRLAPDQALRRLWAGLRLVSGGAKVPVGLSAEPVMPLQVQALAAYERPVPLAGKVPPDMAVSIIIPTKDRHDLLRACIESLSLIRFPAYEVIIIDNGSRTPEMQACLRALAQRPDVRVLRHDIEFNFSRLCNIGAEAARHDWLVFLNDDTEALDGDWLQALCAQALGDRVGIVGARLLYPSGDLQHAGIASHLLPGPGHPWRGASETVWRTHPLLAQAGEVDAVTAACLMVSKALFCRLNGFDENDFGVSLNDVDLCLRAREAGYRVIYTPEATLWHKEGQSRRADDHAAEQPRRQAELAAFVRRHPEAARRSVYYPPHLPRDTDRGDQ